MFLGNKNSVLIKYESAGAKVPADFFLREDCITLYSEFFFEKSSYLQSF